MSELAAEFGGLDRLSAIERTFIEQAATLALRRPHSHEDGVRCANTIRSLLTAVERRRNKRAPDRPDLDAYLARRAAEEPVRS